MSKAQLIDLEQRQLALLKKIIKRYIPNKSVWAYGSRVDWKADEGSDLDLALFGCSPTEVSELREALEESDLLISVDVMDWESIPTEFQENIKKKYVVLQGKIELEGWREVKLGDVFTFGNGKTRPKSKGKIPIYGGNGILGYASTFNYEKETIIVGRVGAYCGSIYFSNKPVWISDNALSARPKGNNNIIYFFYLLRSMDLNKRAQGSSYPLITHSLLNSLSVLICNSFPEQKAIAEVLSSLDDKIDLLNRQNKTLEEMAQALFRKWFVEEAEEGWKMGVLSNEFNITMGQSPPGDSYNEEEIGTPMFQGNADFGFRFPKNRIYTTEPKRFAEKFDTLISVRAPVGEQNMAEEKCCIGRGVATFRYRHNLNYYTYTYFKLRSLMDEIKQFNNEGTIFGSISKTNFEQMEIVLPTKKLVEQFEYEVKSINDKVILNSSQIRTLQKLRDTLLPKLMNGAVRVNYAR